MARRIVMVSLAVLVLAGGCGGKRAKVSTNTSTTALQDSGTSSTAAGGGGTATTARSSAGGSTTTVRGGAATTATTARSSSSGPPTSSSPATAPGRYIYTLSGTSSSSIQPGDQPITGQGTLTVDPVSGTDQHQSRQDPNQTSETVFRFQPDGAYIVNLKQTTSGLAKEFRADPPVLVLPQPATVGRSWQWDLTSTDGATRVHATFKVARTETVTIGGEAVACVVLENTVTTSGDIVSTTTSTIWTSDRYRIVVQQHDVGSGNYGAITFRSDKTSKLQSTRPS